LEITFHEVRTQPGVEIQRQRAGRAILRITPALIDSFSLIVLLPIFNIPGTKSYAFNEQPGATTFSDALATIGQKLWESAFFGCPGCQTICKIDFFASNPSILVLLKPIMGKV